MGRCSQTVLAFVLQINEIQRPFNSCSGNEVLQGIFWSDPTEDDTELGVQDNSRGSSIVSFGPDRVRTFCQVGWA